MTDPIQSSLSAIPGLSLPSVDKSKGSSGELGQSEFLRLMTAQLEAQDPFKPQDSGEFLSQLAQFGTVDGIQALQDSFSSMTTSLQSLQALQASTLVGRSVLVESDLASLTAGSSVEGSIDAKGINNILLSVSNSAGAQVFQQPLTTDANGVANFEWNGQAADGELQPAGIYRFAAQGTRDGQAVALDTRTVAAVASVTLGSGGSAMSLNLAGLGSINADAILEIR